MIDTNGLRGLIYTRGLTQSKLAIKLGMVPKTFYDKMKRGIFGSDEIEEMIILLNIDNPIPIFFTRAVTLKDTTISA